MLLLFSGRGGSFLFIVPALAGSEERGVASPHRPKHQNEYIQKDDTHSESDDEETFWKISREAAGVVEQVFSLFFSQLNLSISYLLKGWDIRDRIYLPGQ